MELFNVRVTVESENKMARQNPVYRYAVMAPDSETAGQIARARKTETSALEAKILSVTVSPVGAPHAILCSIGFVSRLLPPRKSKPKLRPKDKRRQRNPLKKAWRLPDVNKGTHEKA